jgi:hypothetical protein
MGSGEVGGFAARIDGVEKLDSWKFLPGTDGQLRAHHSRGIDA